MSIRWAALTTVTMLIGSLLVAGSAQGQETIDQAAVVGECVDVDGASPLYVGSQAVDCASPHDAEVFALATAPGDLGTPSEVFLTFQQLNALCSPPGDASFEPAMQQYLGVEDVTLPLRIGFAVALPTDDQWQAGDRTVRCLMTLETIAPDLSTSAQSWTGRAPAQVATEGVGWLAWCAVTEPVSGGFTTSGSCIGGRWLLVNQAVPVSGEAGDPYPGEQLQALADQACVEPARPWQIGGSGDLIATVVPRFEWLSGARSTQCWIPFSQWNGATTDVAPPAPVPADATINVTGANPLPPGLLETYLVTLQDADGMGIANAVLDVTVSGNARAVGNLSEVEVVTGPSGDASLVIQPGASGSFTITATAQAQPTVTSTLAVTIKAPPSPDPTITIQGKRTTFTQKGKKVHGVVISGTTVGIASGTKLTGFLKIAPRKKFAKVTNIRVKADGTFTFRKKAAKKAKVVAYVRSTSPKATSPRITIQP